MDGGRTGHIDSGIFEDLDGVATAAALEEFEVGISSGITLGADLVGESPGGRNAGGVLVDVEISVEVRDATPFAFDHVVDDDFRAVIFAVKLGPFGLHLVGGDGAVGLDGFVDIEFEFCKEGLPVEGGADGFRHLMKQVNPLFFGSSLAEQVIEHQRFVGGGSNFGAENRVV